MRNHTIIAALSLAALLVGVPVHAAPADVLTITPQTPAALVRDLRAVLHHAGFKLVAGVGGDPPASVHYIRAFDRLTFIAPARRLLSAQVGIDPLRDYLSTELTILRATRVGSRWIWRDTAADESVTLVYQPAVANPWRALPRPEAELIIVHYTPPHVLLAARAAGAARAYVIEARERR